MPAISSQHFQDPQAVFDQIDAQFQLNDQALIDLAKTFLAEFRLGLEAYNQDMAMIPTFVTGVPDGTEKGTFLALDLGGTNLRVCEVVLNGDKTFNLRQQKYKVSDALKTGEATALFDYLADSVDAFLTDRALSSPLSPTRDEDAPDFLPLGMTFSFPVEQTALNSGKILTWTKGFSAKNAVGNDVVKLLQDAFDRKHIHVKCVALVNDTVGALLSRAYTAGGCLTGAIFGTGTNGAYLEEVAKIKKLAKSPTAPKDGYMLINTEWGAFNNSRSHLPSTPYDMALDRLSINVRYQAFEKFISGMYLGEITRLLLISLIDATPKPLVFGGKSTPVLNNQWALDTSVMSDVEEAWADGGENNVPPFASFESGILTPHVRERLNAVREVVVKQFGFDGADVSLRDAAIVRWASLLVTRRAGLLSGVAIAAVLLQTGRANFPEPDGTHKPVKAERISVGVDGSLIEHYPNFERTLRESLRILVGPIVEQNVDIGLAKDGSGVGAALCALQATKALQQS
ncbi:hypothetical protein BDN72DRAFT_789300 [Pluteus cervinus]|uniref:Uncharacterized protein n=1 Tax=Pluteus cervinus TaxID=181527 RepID=A0ACD3B9F8_9AGAR|nr:hypothetical protein BDN72DRAFT_789300 [Pluteus cervinus]